MKVLFLCTGNYYRSRFAEEYFNGLARSKSLPHRAESRGIGMNFERLKNPGPISVEVIISLKALGILVQAPIRRPRKLKPEEVTCFDRIICMDKKEHLPLVRKTRALKGVKVEYWNIKDLGEAPAAIALPECRKKVEELVEKVALQQANA
jgi:protein-tyrosine phosphatase